MTAASVLPKSTRRIRPIPAAEIREASLLTPLNLSSFIFSISHTASTKTARIRRGAMIAEKTSTLTHGSGTGRTGMIGPMGLMIGLIIVFSPYC